MFEFAAASLNDILNIYRIYLNLFSSCSYNVRSVFETVRNGFVI